MQTGPAQPSQPPALLAFDGFVRDLSRGVLTAEAREVVLRPRTAAVLAHLLAHAGQVVSRDALLTAVWGDLAVTDDNLTQCVSEIRRAFGADAARMLETHARRGYRMATRPRLLALPVPSPAPAPVAPPVSAASMPAGTPRRGPLNAAALLVGLGAVALAAAAWMRAEPTAPPAPALPVAAASDPSSGDRAWALVDQGHAIRDGTGPWEARLRASLALYLRALEVEPRLGNAAAHAAFTHLNLRFNGFSQDPELDLREGVRLAALAMELAPEDSISLSAQATVLRHQGRFAEALRLHERAAADPARVIDLANTGLTHLLLGDPEAAQPPLRAALERAPRHIFSPNWRGHLALALLLAGEADQAADDFLTAGRLYYVAEDRPLFRLAALQGAGRLAEAEALNAELRQQYPARTEPLRAALASNEPRYRALFETAVLAPLRGMGWFQADQ